MNMVEDLVETNLTEQTLWTEMLGRWKQILKAVATKRVVPDRAFEIFREAGERVYTVQSVEEIER